MKLMTVILIGLVAVSAKREAWENEQLLPNVDDVLTSQYMAGNDGKDFLLDLWSKAVDLEESSRYNADYTNNYHLFTRENPTLSQPILFNNHELLTTTNYNSNRRTIVLIHGWLDNVTAAMNTVLVPAFLQAEDVNVIVVDWSNGSGTIAYPVAVINTAISGESVARFITWLNNVSGSTLKNYHIVGHNLGAHQAGIVGRHLRGEVAYITGLDPAFTGWITNDDRFKATDGIYTEVIHTNAGLLGYLAPLADVDFYPNGGIDMPGCFSQECDSNRSFHYFGESIRTGGFTGTRCLTFASAMAGQCFLSGPIPMGGISSKIGAEAMLMDPKLGDSQRDRIVTADYAVFYLG